MIKIVFINIKNITTFTSKFGTNMFYPEYAIAARTHYQSCKFIFDSCVLGAQNNVNMPDDVLFRLYYLCGHIVECASIYLIYNHFRYESDAHRPTWNGKNTHLHQSYNKRFTIDSHMDFFPITIQNGKIKSKKRTHKGTNDFVCFGLSFPGETEKDYFNIQRHEFQSYVKNIIWSQLAQDVPYLRPRCPQDAEYETALDLLDYWTTDLRYYYEKRKSGSYKLNSQTLPAVNRHNIAKLLEVCGKIIAILPSGNQI